MLQCCGQGTPLSMLTASSRSDPPYCPSVHGHRRPNCRALHEVDHVRMELGVVPAVEHAEGGGHDHAEQ